MHQIRFSILNSNNKVFVTKHGKGSFITNTQRLKIIGHCDSLKRTIKIHTVLLNK